MTLFDDPLLQPPADRPPQIVADDAPGTAPATT